jgi:hypothetical protein
MFVPLTVLNLWPRPDRPKKALVRDRAFLVTTNSKRLPCRLGPSHRSCVGGPSAGYSLSVPSVGLGLDGSAAEDSGGAELCSLAPPDVSAVPAEGFMASAGFASLAAPDEGGAELCSLAPVEVSAPPDGVAWSAAKAGVRAIKKTIPVLISSLDMVLSLDD